MTKLKNRFYHCPKCGLKTYLYVKVVRGYKKCPICKENIMHQEKDHGGSQCNAHYEKDKR